MTIDGQDVTPSVLLTLIALAVLVGLCSYGIVEMLRTLLW